MGGWGVSRARRVRCGADLLPSRLLPFSSVAIPSDAKRDLSIRMRPVCTCLRSVHERLSMQPSAREGRRVLPSSRMACAIHTCNTWPYISLLLLKTFSHLNTTLGRYRTFTLTIKCIG